MSSPLTRSYAWPFGAQYRARSGWDGGGVDGVEEDPPEDAHTGRMIVLPSSVTSPFRASKRPLIVAPCAAVMLVKARIVPLMLELVPIVAELRTCQKTLQACAPPANRTLLELAKTRSLVAWKIQTELALPSSVRVPVRLAVVALPNR